MAVHMAPPTDASASDESVPPSRAIVEAIAQREGVDATEIAPPEYEPLYAVVNPEALDALFEQDLASESSRSLAVGFEYEGYDVVVHGDGRVEVSESSDATESLPDRFTD